MDIDFSTSEVSGIGEVTFATNKAETSYQSHFVRSEFRLLDANLLAFELMKQMPSRQFVDVGANIGMFSIPIAMSGARTLSVEANAENVVFLQQAALKNRLDRMTIVHCAASDKPGVLSFQGSSAWGHVLRDGEAVESVSVVPAARVDDLARIYGFSEVGLVKIDVEGFEKFAIEGMNDLLASPSVRHCIFEAHALACAAYDYSVSDLKLMLKGHGFSSYMLVGNKLCPIDDAKQTVIAIDMIATRDPKPSTPSFFVGELTDDDRTRMLRDICASSNHEEHAFALALDRLDPSVRRLPIASEIEALKSRYNGALDALIARCERGIR